MADREVQRRLAAVLAADVAGYTRLMEQDTDGTVAAWQDAREDIIKPQVNEYSGTIVKLTGDGFLVEFPTVQDAVNCAIAMQHGLASSSLEFRMGVNLGDIVDDGEDIHGEGVNVAARIEALADPGGISISGEAYTMVRNRIDVDYEDRGEHEVKNVSAPVRVYAIQLDSPVGAISASVEQSIANKPAIAVLPFDNLSGDPEQDFIGDGLTEDIITGLSRIRSFFVIARNSTFQYKGTSPDIRRVAEELDVRYVLEGSVRRSGERIRVTAQLIDAANNNHLWAERFDREFTDIFALQDEITSSIIAQLEPELGLAEYERHKSEPPENLDAWELFHRGNMVRARWGTENFQESRGLFQRAIEIDPDFARAHAGLCWVNTNEQFQEGTGGLDLEENIGLAQRAIELDPKDAFAHLTLGMVYSSDQQLSEGIKAYEESLRINPSYAHAHIWLSGALSRTGRPKEGLSHAQMAMRLSPADPSIGEMYQRMAMAHHCLGNYEQVVEWAGKAISKNAPWPNHALLTSALAHLGRSSETERAKNEMLRVNQSITVEYVNQRISNIDDLLAGLRLAGLSESLDPGPTDFTLPDKPSIAVLAFDNLSGDPEQEYFSDGITEDIITALSRIRQFFVIARNTTFTFKGQAVNVQAVAEDLGVRYVLEGSVRKAGGRVRITAQLIDGETGNHLWAEKYDRDLEDIFAVQDDITLTIVGELQPELSRAEWERAHNKPSDNLDAWTTLQKAISFFYATGEDAQNEAIKLAERATQLDPKFSLAHAWEAAMLTRRRIFGRDEFDHDRAYSIAQRALELDAEEPMAHYALGYCHYAVGQFDTALEEFEETLRLNPNHDQAKLVMGRALVLMARHEEAIHCYESLIKTSPRDPLIGIYFAAISLAYLCLRDYEKSISWSSKAVRYPRALHAPAYLLSALGHAERTDEARAALSELQRVQPEYSISFLRENFLNVNDDDMIHFLDGLRKGGLVEV